MKTGSRPYQRLFLWQSRHVIHQNDENLIPKLMKLLDLTCLRGHPHMVSDLRVGR